MFVPPLSALVGFVSGPVRAPPTSVFWTAAGNTKSAAANHRQHCENIIGRAWAATWSPLCRRFLKNDGRNGRVTVMLTIIGDTSGKNAGKNAPPPFDCHPPSPWPRCRWKQQKAIVSITSQPPCPISVGWLLLTPCKVRVFMFFNVFACSSLLAFEYVNCLILFLFFCFPSGNCPHAFFIRWHIQKRTERSAQHVKTSYPHHLPQGFFVDDWLHFWHQKISR